MIEALDVCVPWTDNVCVYKKREDFAGFFAVRKASPNALDPVKKLEYSPPCICQYIDKMQKSVNPSFVRVHEVFWRFFRTVKES